MRLQDLRRRSSMEVRRPDQYMVEIDENGQPVRISERTIVSRLRRYG